MKKLGDVVKDKKPDVKSSRGEENLQKAISSFLGSYRV
jgi:hypothetical protein